MAVLSYINWPYSHGFNRGEDNVFSRNEAIEKLYREGEILNVVRKYDVDYLYLGSEEKNNYPLAEEVLAVSRLIKEVYNQGGIKIFKVNK